MTTARRAAPSPDTLDRRRQERRRLGREELAAALVLVAILAVAVVLLSLQWLGGAPSTASSAPGASPAFSLGGFA